MLLVINSGSSSIKYKLFEIKRETLLFEGSVGRIGGKGSCVENHYDAIKIILGTLRSKRNIFSEGLAGIRAVGHRVVHGGEKFKNPVVVDKDVLKAVERFSKWAPLHNPANLMGIRACMRFFRGVCQVAVFDTAYYQTIPQTNYMYAIPYRLYKEDGIRRYGFHGTSHKYVALKTAEILGKPIKDLKIITCHLGNGCSITATMNGKAVDTSMGFTPLEGLVMGTRGGDIDPAVILYLMEEKGMTKDRIYELLNKKSGLLGISGISSDMRDIHKAIKKNSKRARLAFDMFIHRIHKYIGAFCVGMNGLDAISFTGGIGQRHPLTRKMSCRNLKFLNVELDEKKNRSNSTIISKRGSDAKILVIPTDEELMIAKETKDIIS